MTTNEKITQVNADIHAVSQNLLDQHKVIYETITIGKHAHGCTLEQAIATRDYIQARLIELVAERATLYKSLGVHVPGSEETR